MMVSSIFLIFCVISILVYVDPKSDSLGMSVLMHMISP